MDFQQFRATINRLQYYDSFPGDGDTENQLHKIVKKQMAVSDYKDLKKNKRSISDFPESFDKDDENDSHAKKRAAIDPVSQIRHPSEAQPRRMRSLWRKASSGTADTRAKADASQQQTKNKSNRWFRHELRHKRWPRERSFSWKHSRNTDAKRGGKDTPKRGISKQTFDNTEDADPPNEWLDASKGGVIQKIPAEFRPKKKPRLKIYHLRVKRKPQQVMQNIVAGHHAQASAHLKNHRKAAGAVRGMPGTRHHQPRSFVIRINKKYGKDNQDEKLTDGDENDEEDEEAEEEEDDEEDPEEDEDAEEDEDFDTKQTDGGVTSHKDSFKDLLRSAKAAVTNRVKFAESPGVSDVSQKSVSHAKGKKSEVGYSPKNKKVLIDANIKVDSALSDVLKNILKTTGIAGIGKTSTASDSDVVKSFDRLSRNNPRSRRSREKEH